LSEIVPSLNPAKKQELIRTTKFKLYSTDVMPMIYRFFGQYQDRLQSIPKDQLTSSVFRGIAEEGTRRLVFAAATEGGVTVPKDSVTAYIDKIYKNMGGEKQFLQTLASEGMTLDDVKSDLKLNLTIQKFMESTVLKNISVSDREVEQAYSGDRYATVRHILMNTQNKSDSAKTETRKKMEDMQKRAKKGEDFSKLAKQYSEDPGSKNNGGLYEKFERGSMVQPFDSLAFSLPLGSVSEVFETPYGYHVMKVVSREKENKPIGQVRASIQNRLLNKKKQEAYENLIKTLKLKYQYKELWNTI
jgi:parvulin-like peptidyl-prolyl isomerase